MCGIAGGIHSGLSRQQTEEVLARLKHRGPDDSGLYVHENLWLGNTRLAIQDLSSRGHQPMRTPDGRLTLVFNGEIYNHQALRPELERAGAQFSSSCDTETLLQAYALWGKACLDRLEGDFAFAVFDAGKNELFIARDAMGVKPLYFYLHENTLLFASELKALVGLHGVDYELAPEVFFQYILFQYSPSADTPFRHIKKLLPGHCLSVPLGSPATATPQRWYSIPFSNKYQHRTKREWTDLLEDSLKQVVTAQLHSDAALGLTLSGGLDSSLIASLAKNASPGQKLEAFCINTHGAMKAEGFADDLPFARLVAGALGITLHEVSGTLNLPDELDAMIWQLDEPQADPAALHMAHIAQAAHDRGIKVLLSGAGADDVFSGYRRHRALPVLRALSRLSLGLAGMTRSVVELLPSSPAVRRLLKLIASAGLSLEESMIHTHFWIDKSRGERLFETGILFPGADQMPYRLIENILREAPWDIHRLNKMLLLEQRTFLPHHNLAYMDKLGMASSVEVRVPFVDKSIVELAASMPSGLKLHGNTTKFILREVAKRHLPPDVIQRKKTGFGAPLRQWMKRDLRDWVSERLSDKSFIGRGIFDRASIEALIADNQSGSIDGSYTLFSLLSIESWLRQFAPPA